MIADETRPAKLETPVSMMKSCKICFVYRRGPRDTDDDDTIYIAPDLLPDRTAVQGEIDSGWDIDLPTESITFDYALLHPGLMRGVIARVGNRAGLHAVYWRGGVCVYEKTTRSRALIEQEIPQGSWRGSVRLQTKGGQAGTLLDQLAGWISEENDRMGLRPSVSRSLPPPRRQTDTPLAFGPEPAMQPQYCVSYAWNDPTPGGPDREEIVDRLCVEAEGRGIHIIRDKTDVRVGDRLSAFTRRLAQCERVFVIMSEKYLRSIYCMAELYEIWLRCQSSEDNFIARVRVFTLPDARIGTIFERNDHREWWRDQHARVTALVNKDSQDSLSTSDYQQFRLMGHFVRHMPEILSVVQDTLRPRTFEDLVRHGFDDPPL